MKCGDLLWVCAWLSFFPFPNGNENFIYWNWFIFVSRKNVCLFFLLVVQGLLCFMNGQLCQKSDGELFIICMKSQWNFILLVWLNFFERFLWGDLGREALMKLFSWHEWCLLYYLINVRLGTIEDHQLYNLQNLKFKWSSKSFYWFPLIF